MKFINLVWLHALTSLLILSSCMKEYETPPVKYRQLCVTASYEDRYMFISDSGSKFVTDSIPSDYEFEVDKRVMIVFTEFLRSEVADYDYIFVPETVVDIATKQILFINEENKDTLGYDDVVINNAYASGKYLNIDITFGASGSIPHYFNTSFDYDLQTSNDTLVLTFHHKNNDDRWMQSFSGFLSFDLRSLGENQLLPPYVITLISTDIQGNESKESFRVVD